VTSTAKVSLNNNFKNDLNAKYKVVTRFVRDVFQVVVHGRLSHVGSGYIKLQ
jgi:hypothetical protein